MFVPLKVTTDYTMLQSIITIPKLLLFLQKYQISICGICDKNLYGVMEFYDTMESNHIKPIIGLEITINSIPLYLYARDNIGYSHLLKIHTIKERRELTILDLETREEHLNIVLPYQEINYFETFSFSHFYIGCSSSYEKNNAFIKTRHVINCPDLKAFSKKEEPCLRMLKAIDTGSSYRDILEENIERNCFETFYKEDFLDESTKEFIDSCNVKIDKSKKYIPVFDKKISSSNLLFSLAKKGLEKRCNQNIPLKYAERLKYELSVIQKMGFCDYFLIVYDYVKYAKTSGILVGAGRGSAVGSLVSYSLGITDVDPLEYDLLFERFLNPDRVTMPDIDIDFEEERRDEVVEYVKKRYGNECVGNILTFGTLKSKLVLRSVGKALEMNPNLIDAFVNKIDAKLSLKENLKNKEITYFIETNEGIKKMYEISLKLEGLKKHTATHAAGVVISSVSLDEVIPIHYNDKELLTGVTMNYLEELGLLKMDFLALRNLTIMKNVLNLIKEYTKENLDIHKIPLNDPKVLELFTKGNTIGIFQFESEGMKNFLKKLKPTKFLDLVSAIALYRPGPMENIDTYIRRKEGLEPINYLHDDLISILKETYGIIVYQEQIMQILVKIGGFRFSEADVIRRAMSKKKKETIENFKEQFLKGAEKNGYDLSLAKEIFDLILKFANYGFNKSHSVSYALIGYQMAYLKCYYPVYFIANRLNMSINEIDKTKEYLALAKKMGLTILPVDINKSENTYKIEGKSLRVPFVIIKTLGEEMSKTIIQNRTTPYIDFFDFAARTYGKNITRKTMESLISAGAFDTFTKNHNTLRANIDSALNYAVLRGDLEEDYVMKPTLEEKEEETLEEKRKEEYNSFGFYLSNHPSSKYISENIMKLDHITRCFNKHIECVVFIEKIKQITTKKNERMAFVTASDETDSGNFVVFASTMKYLDAVTVGDLVKVEGRVARRMADYQINVNKLEKINEGEEV